MLISKLQNIEFIKKIKAGWFYATFTDNTIITSWPVTDISICGKYELLLECRVFDGEKEYRMFRMNLEDDFKCREIDDTGKELDVIDEYQYINRFDRESIKKNQILIRNYIDYEVNSGQAYISKWRMAGFK